MTAPTILSSKVELDEATAKASEAFDFSFDGTTSFEVPAFTPPDDFQLMLIVGPSGSGKSSILKQYFGGATLDPVWNPNKAVVSHFASPEDALQRLSSIGFNSVPAWCRPRHVLSNGEGHRADLARQLNDNAVIDEFTSVVNREAARSCAVGVRRLVDSMGLKRVVMATCHYDVIEWLQPDFVFDTATGVMTPRGSLPPRPRIELEILPASPAIWSVFAPHHYLTQKLHPTANCWIAVWDGVLVGFASSLPFPHAQIKRGYRETRTVVLPDYQGLGIGVRLSDAIADLHVMAGKRYFSKTAHPRMGQYRDRHPAWKVSKRSGKRRTDSGVTVKPRNVNVDSPSARKTPWVINTARICYSHEWIGVEGLI